MSLMQIDLLAHGFGTDYATGLAYGYYAGTSTPCVWYEDAGGTTPAANPYTLNTLGAAVLYSADRLKIDVQNVSGVSAPGFPIDNLGFSYTAPDTRIDVSTYGNTLDVTTIQAAIDAQGTTEGTLYFKPGTWTVDANFSVPSTLAFQTDNGTHFVIQTGKTIAIGGPFYAGLYEVFGTTGTVTFATDSCPATYAIWGANCTDTMKDGLFTGLKAVDGAGSGLDADKLDGKEGLAYLQGGYIYIRDEKTEGTNGGSFTSGSWHTRDLNTKVVDTDSIATLSSNQISLPAGTYRYHIEAPGYSCQFHKARLQNITAASTIDYGTVEQTTSASMVNTRSTIRGRMTLAVTTTLEVQHYCSVTQNTTGFGPASNFTGAPEIYTTVEIWREA